MRQIRLFLVFAYICLSNALVSGQAGSVQSELRPDRQRPLRILLDRSVGKVYATQGGLPPSVELCDWVDVGQDLSYNCPSRLEKGVVRMQGHLACSCDSVVLKRQRGVL